jgi:hypothetical protein
MASNPHKNTWETYTQSWSEIDTTKRLQLFQQCLSPGCVCSDPIILSTGYEQLSEYMSEQLRLWANEAIQIAQQN